MIPLHTYPEWLKLTRLAILNAGENVGQLAVSYTTNLFSEPANVFLVICPKEDKAYAHWNSKSNIEEKEQSSKTYTA